jgi:putative aldouronate transport system permease protein
MVVASLQRKSKTQSALRYYRRYWTLYMLLLLPLAFFLVFRYIPMIYIQMAFKQNNIIKNIWDVPWAKNNGSEWFIKAFSNRDFWFALRNTVTLNFLDLVVGFPAPILLALLLNELTFKGFKRITQTIAYMPHFLSWIIISSLAKQLFAPNMPAGLVNIIVSRMGGQSIPFLDNPAYWVATYIMVGVWQSVGWNTIIYLAALSGINLELYEAASVDGAGRFRKMRHITLPGLRPTIVTLLIMNLGRILGSEFDRPYAMSNKLVTGVSNVISIFVYNNGIKSSQFSLTSAVGLFQSAVCVIFLVIANHLAKKFGERGIW